MGELTVRWEDPAALAERARGMPGLAFLEAIRDGELPAAPIQSLLGFRLVEVEEGRVAFSAEPGEHHYNPIGVVHGGLAATLLDSAMGASVHSTLPARLQLLDPRDQVQPGACDHGRERDDRGRGPRGAPRKPRGDGGGQGGARRGRQAAGARELDLSGSVGLTGSRSS